MRAGKLRDEIQIQSRSATKDSIGQPVETWTTDATVLANIKSVAGREYVGANGEVALATCVVEMRNMQGITPAKRIVCGARIIDIGYVPPYSARDAKIELLGQERTA